ncbi:MAG: hypothetical protein K2J57_02120, partial [Bacteroidales bacterium]|nr:hypothetical protein [Bacteroidales bacterium]
MAVLRKFKGYILDFSPLAQPPFLVESLHPRGIPEIGRLGIQIGGVVKTLAAGGLHPLAQTVFL